MTSKAHHKHHQTVTESLDAAKLPAEPGDGGKTKMLLVAFGLVLVIIIILALNSYRSGGPAGGQATTLFTNPDSRQWDVAQAGDVVEVEYTGKFQNGTIFDTSQQDLAVQAGVYNQMRVYQPIVFTIGLHEVITGVEEAIVGMKTGENKTVTIPPEKAYGRWSQDNIEAMPRMRNSSRVEDVPLNIFYNVTGEMPVAGTSVEVKGIPWTITVLEIKNDVVTVKHNPQNGTVIPTIYGNTTLTLTDDRIYARLEVKPGDKLITDMGFATVLDVTNESIIVDANHELADVTLVYDLKLVSINQVEDIYAKEIQQQILQGQQLQG